VGKLLLHNPPLSPEEIEDRRLSENLALTHRERFIKAMSLMRLGVLFSKNGFGKPRGLGVVLKRKIHNDRMTK
jgi:hypothetical protein